MIVDVLVRMLVEDDADDINTMSPASKLLRSTF
jgi:hypothetical protein